MSTRRQQGSIEMILIGVLAIGLLAAVGYIAWNAMSKKTSTDASSVSSPESTKKQALKTFCAPKEKLCFDYPSGWSVKDTLPADTIFVTENYTVLDQTARPRLVLSVGSGVGFGGACAPEADAFNDVVVSERTKLTTSIPDTANTPVYVVGYIAGDKDVSGNMVYSVKAELNASAGAAKTGKFDGCSVGVGMFDAKNTKESVITFGFDSAFTDTSFSSEQDAKAVLETSEAKQSFDILASTRYE